jgi:hypothetical protein
MTAGTTPAAKPLIPRIKYWLDLYKVYGMATESSIEVLHFPDIFLIGLSGALHPHAAFLLQLAVLDRRYQFVGPSREVMLQEAHEFVLRSVVWHRWHGSW